MDRFINTQLVVAAQMTTPAENPLVTDNNRLMDIWFGGGVVRKQMFKKVTRDEQEAFLAKLLERGFVRSGNLLIDPGAILFAEMENQLLGGLVTLGYGENGKPVELKISAQAFADLSRQLAGS
jgi:hypothetical protein